MVLSLGNTQTIWRAYEIWAVDGCVTLFQEVVDKGLFSFSAIHDLIRLT